MISPWTPPTPIESLFEQLKEGKEFASEGSETIENAQLMRMSYNNIKATGLFNDQCCLWRAKPAADKTYDNLVEYFTNCDNDRRQNEVTSGSAGYSANAVQEIVQREMANYISDQPPPQLTQADIDALLTPEEPVQEAANAGVTIADIKDLFKTMITEQNNGSHNNRNTRRSQG